MQRRNYPISLTITAALLALYGVEAAASTISYWIAGRTYFEVAIVSFLIVPGLVQLRQTARAWALAYLSIYACALLLSSLLVIKATNPSYRVFGVTTSVLSAEAIIVVTITIVAVMAWQIYVLMRTDVRRWFQRPEGICRACGYNLQASPGDFCPECGYVPEVFSYPVTIRDEAQSRFSVAIPDLPGVSADGMSAEDAVGNAKTAAIKHVRGLIKRGESIPRPRPMNYYMANQDSTNVLWAAVEVDLAAMRSHLGHGETA